MKVNNPSTEDTKKLSFLKALMSKGNQSCELPHVNTMNQKKQYLFVSILLTDLTEELDLDLESKSRSRV